MLRGTRRVLRGPPVTRVNEFGGEAGRCRGTEVHLVHRGTWAPFLRSGVVLGTTFTCACCAMLWCIRGEGMSFV
jgi:hypothetical protein